MELHKRTYSYGIANVGDISQEIPMCLLLPSLCIYSTFRLVLQLSNCLGGLFLLLVSCFVSVFKWEIRWEPSNEFAIISQSPCKSGMMTFELIYSLRNSSSKYCNQQSLYKMVVQYLSTCVPPCTLNYSLLSYGTLNRSAPAQYWDTKTQGNLRK